MEEEKLYYMIENGRGRLSRIDIDKIYQKLIDDYNQCMADPEAEEKQINSVTTNIIINFRLADPAIRSLEFIQSAIILLLVQQEGGYNSWRGWIYSALAGVAFAHGDLELAREFVILDLKVSGIGDVRNANPQYIVLSKEDKEQNTADVLGILMEELGEEKPLTEEQCRRLLEDFAELLNRWRNLEVPKVQQEGSYELIYEMVRLCFENRAYHTAMRLSGLLFVADQTKEKEHLSETLLLLGKVLYELKYLEAAKRCFLFVDKDTEGACLEAEEEKYRELLQQETKLEMNEELLENLRVLQEKIENNEIKLYTEEERDRQSSAILHHEEPPIPFIDLKKQKKAREKLGEKAVAKYEKYAQGTVEERLKGIEEAFAVLKEEPEVYEVAAYLYFLKGNCYLSQNDCETAYECFQKAYRCENGKRNGMVLFGMAVILGQMGKVQEATAYAFRAYILCGKQFIIEKGGEQAWKRIQSYLKKN